MNTTTDTYPATARVWVYMADRELTEEEASTLEHKAGIFTSEWAAHGKALQAGAEVRYSRFLILMVDQDQHLASGCSIDSSVHFIHEAGEALQIDFFNRLLLAYRDEDNRIQTAPVAKIKELVANGTLRASTLVFNNLVDNKGSLDTSWEVPLSQSPFSRWL